MQKLSNDRHHILAKLFPRQVCVSMYCMNYLYIALILLIIMIIFGAKGSLKKDSECIIIPPQDQANSKKKEVSPV